MFRLVLALALVYTVAGQCNSHDQLIGDLCFTVFNLKLRYLDAQSACNQNNKSLAVIHNTFQSNFLASLVRHNSSSDPFWIGLSRATTGSRFQWNDGTTMTWSNFDSSLPKNQLYVAENTFNGKWQTLDGQQALYFACSYYPGVVYPTEYPGNSTAYPPSGNSTGYPVSWPTGNGTDSPVSWPSWNTTDYPMSYPPSNSTGYPWAGNGTDAPMSWPSWNTTDYPISYPPSNFTGFPVSWPAGNGTDSSVFPASQTPGHPVSGTPGYPASKAPVSHPASLPPQDSTGSPVSVPAHGNTGAPVSYPASRAYRTVSI